MAIGLDLDVDRLDINKALKRFSVESGVAITDIVADQMRLWLQYLIGPKVFLPKGPGVGKRAVQTDLNKLFVGIRQKPVLQFFDDEFGHKVPADVQFNVEGDMIKAARWHERKRRKSGSKAGSVRYRGKVVSSEGGYKLFNKMYLPKRTLNKIMKDHKSRVGTLKAGWLPAYEKMKRRVGRGKAAPMWLRRVRWKLGRGTIRMVAGNGYVESTNSAKYVNEKYTSFVEFGRTVRDADIQRQMRKRMDGMVDQFNSGRKIAA